MDGDTGFPVESFKLFNLGFLGAKVRDEPGGRLSEENRARLDRSKWFENIRETIIVLNDKITWRGTRSQGGDSGEKGVQVDILNIAV